MISIDKNAVHHESPADRPVQLSIRLGHGAVEIHAEPGRTTATVDITARDGERDSAAQIGVTRSGDTITVQGPRQGGLLELFGERRRTLSADVVIRVPAGSGLRIVTFTADLTVHGELGTSDVGTGTAALHLARVAGDLRLRSGAASVTVGDVSGNVQLRSGSGEMRLASVGGDLEAVWGGGRLHVGETRGRVRARTGAGPVHVGCVRGDVDLHSGSGGMEIGLPAGVTARVDARTAHGTVSSELPVDDSPADARNPITIRARTGSGDVRIFRAG